MFLLELGSLVDPATSQVPVTLKIDGHLQTLSDVTPWSQRPDMPFDLLKTRSCTMRREDELESWTKRERSYCEQSIQKLHSLR